MNGADNHGYTALHLAMLHRHESTVKCLLDRHASVNSRTKDGKSVRDIAYGMRNSERCDCAVHVQLKTRIFFHGISLSTGSKHY